MLQAKVSIVLLNWNGWRDTVACLESLRQLRYPNFDVIVVDNGSTDDSVARIRETFPDVDLIEAGKNLGFAAGCNLGAVHALSRGSEYVWLLNNDTVADPGALAALIEKAEANPQIGVVGSVLYCADEPERVQCWGGGYVSFRLGRSRPFVGPVPDEKLEFITGASFLLPRKVIKKFGLLDEGYFMYWEDADYCFGLRRAGLKLAVAERSKVWHKESASVGKVSARLDNYFNASAARFFARHASLPGVTLWTGVTLRLAKRILAGDWGRALAVWNGVRGRRLEPTLLGVAGNLNRAGD
ncbi:MAG TPA: glycosyltransferase family 2 protein [Candidatus Binatia bacterium]|nr:glycosyltransferase family 2 protein [Candidatus Binatia bacterium]